MFIYRSLDQILEEFEQRKNENRKIATEFNYTELNTYSGRTTIVTTNDKGEPDGCLCKHCFKKLDHLPFSYGKYVSPICTYCLKDIYWIESTNKKEIKMKKRTSKNDPSTLNIKWNEFESMVNNGTAKLVELAKTYNVYPNDLKTVIVAKYGDNVEFKKGRNGGIRFNNTAAAAPTI